ncbi:MAG: hypothetical protein QG577_116 [Thermodesulfobacteriota bacterium]|nr:hypothetical protein [Thermodesulfobacteriota bacterium]
MHSPIVVLLYCLLLSFFFSDRHRKRFFFLLVVGSMFHLALDYLQINYDSAYFPFFPFSFWHSPKGLFWPEDSLALLPPFAGIFLIASIVRLLIKRRGKTKP